MSTHQDSAPSQAPWQGQPQQPPVVPYAPPPKQKHTLRNVLLTIITLCVLGMVGCTAVVFAGIGKVATDISKGDAAAGGPNNPLTITVGKAFEVQKFTYASGWKVGTDALGDLSVTGLKVTNNRDAKDSALVEIKFMKGTEVLALVDCSTEPVMPGQTTTLTCFSSDKLPKGYDAVTINDTL